MNTAIIGPYLKHNFGDDLIGGVFARAMRQDGRTAIIPGLGAENCEWLRIPRCRSVTQAIFWSTSVLIGGGGILGNSGLKPSLTYFKRSAFATGLARLLRRDVHITGVGAGPIVQPWGRRLVRYACASASKIGVRDDESKSFLCGELNIAPEKITVGADVALLWPDFFSLKPETTGALGIQFNPIGFGGQETEARRQLQTVATWINGRADDIVLISNGRSNSQLYSQVTGPRRQLLYSVLPEFLPKLCGLRAIVTSHLHLSIAAYAARIPCFAIYGREKTKRFFAQIGRPERAIPLEGASDADIQRILDCASKARWELSDEARLKALKVSATALLPGRL